ncbi:polysaccharide deacetylase family protein [Prolixibacter bellariivorans]|uniref:polysaccharide deacetylase family protein n=1 Tax=Prolixibacter bellariivorans TaxID=314319 RepID=UPI000486E252|nr:polysaccharide deacetylase family protein [Prolixibacter bellariivorans]
MILIYSNNLSPRLNYTVRYIFNDLIPTTFQVTNDPDLVTRFNGPIINYSDNNELPGLHIFPHGLLFSEKLVDFVPQIDNSGEIPLLFPVSTSGKSELTFDVFAAVFWMVSRYEEYFPKGKTDIHGRFRAEASFAFQHHFLQRPVVDLWAELLADAIATKWPQWEKPMRRFRYISTIDVDNAYAILHKSMLRKMTASFRSIMNPRKNRPISVRKEVLKGQKPDPYDTYAEMEKMHETYNVEAVFFFLLGDYGKFDKNLSYRNVNYRALIRDTSKKVPVGIHPSYKASGAHKMLETEVKRLSKIIGESPFRSRFHYLRLTFPQSYQWLIDTGIKEDYTLTYHSRAGFRAGTCTPFRFYDLSSENETNLKIFPTTVMEVSLKQYQEQTPKEAIETINRLMMEVKKVNGTFVSLFHNESLSDSGEWKGWKKVFKSMLKKAGELRDE